MTVDWLKLDGRFALITGVGSKRGIGFAAAEAIAELGAKIFITSQSDRCLERSEELRLRGFDVSAFPADLMSHLEIEMLFSEVSKLGELSILVNNAGMSSIDQPMSETGESHGLLGTTREAFELSISRNLTSAFELTKLFLPALRRNNGRIVNVASVTGPVMAMRDEVSYAAAKSGLLGLTKAIALDEAAHGVRANAVAPGWIATESQTTLEADQGIKVPVGRSATPEEVGRVIALLATQATSYITGQLIVVDGGNSIAEER